MFKKSRIKIVASIMSILVCLFLGTLAVIFATSYFEVSTNNYNMLKRHSEMYFLNNNDNKPPEIFEPIPNKPSNEPSGKRFEDNPAFQLSTFYSVTVDNGGNIIEVDVAGGDIYNEKTLKQYALDILKKGKEKGKKGSLIFIVTKQQGFSLISFMDNTILQESMTTLFRNTLVFGSVTLIVLFFLAVYLAKRIVKPLEESYQKQKQFISDAGHELKTPVSVVSANTELLSREIGDNQWLNNIQYENERMGKLICQLLELARTEDVTPKTECLDLSRLVAGDTLPFESVAFEKGLVINTKIAENISINGNGSQLSQLVAILIDNAIRYGQSGKEIKVELKESRNNVYLSVINDGPPIPLEKQQQLFERFYRVDQARNSADEHYGLGLSIAKAIVTAHNGKIEVSCYDGKVCFTVQLPKI